jgi:small subunit ribosomal protein S14
MARLSVINREKKRQKLVSKYLVKRRDLLSLVKSTSDESERLLAFEKLCSLPKDSNPNRRRSRCSSTGRPRAVYRQFGLCGNQIRSLSMAGIVPGIVKASW